MPVRITRLGCVAGAIVILCPLWIADLLRRVGDPTRPDPKEVSIAGTKGFLERSGVEVDAPDLLFVDRGVNAFILVCRGVRLDEGRFKAPDARGARAYRPGSRRYGWARTVRLASGDYFVGVLASTDAVEYRQTNDGITKIYEEHLERRLGQEADAP